MIITNSLGQQVGQGWYLLFIMSFPALCGTNRYLFLSSFKMLDKIKQVDQWNWTKKPDVKPYSGRMNASSTNGTGLTECQNVEECN